jgi:hypothetical protein
MNTPIEVCRVIFGEHPEDVIYPLEYTTEVLGWLCTLFTVIADDALDKNKAHHVKGLAEAGRHIAADIIEYAQGRHESMASKMSRVIGGKKEQPEDA